MRAALLVAAMALATVLAVAAASSIGTLRTNIEEALGRMVGRSDLQLVHQFGSRLPRELLDTVRSWPEVDTATLWLDVGVQARVDRAPRPVNALLRGIDPAVETTLHPMPMLSGRLPEGDGEVTIDQSLAESLVSKVGDTITLLTFGKEPREVRVVGVFERPTLAVLQQPVMLATLPLADALAEQPGMLDVVHVKLRDSDKATRDAVSTRYADAVDASVRFHTPASATAGINRGIKATSFLLSVILTVVYLSAALIVLTSLTTAVTQRSSELATLRCIGGTRAQVAGTQLFSGVLLGLAGAAVGAPLGLLVGYWIYARFRDMLPAGFDPNWPGVATATAVAVVSGLIGAAYPAWLAASVQPLDALKARARKPTPGRVVLCLVLGVLCAATIPLLLLASFSPQVLFFAYAWLGIPLTLGGYFLLSVPVMVALTWLLHRPLAVVLRLPASLLRETVMATPYRHGFTGGTLMVSLAMLVSVWTGGRGVMDGWFADLQMPDAFVATPIGFGLDEAQLDKLRSLDAVAGVSPTTVVPVTMLDYQLGLEQFSPRNTWFFGFDPDAFFSMATLDWTQGDPATAIARLKQGGAVLISREYFLAHGLGVGDTVKLQTLRGPVDFDVAGVVSSKGLDLAVHFFGLQGTYGEAAVSTVFGLRSDAATHFGWERSRIALLALHPDVDDRKAIAAIHEALPGVAADSSRAIRRASEQSASGILRVATTVAIAAMGIACFGIGNLIIAEVTSRRFEYGVLRAIGAQRWLLGRLLGAQIVLIALTGCVTGTVLGMQFALMDRTFYERIGGLVYPVKLPVDVVALGWLAALSAAMVAGLPTLWKLVHEPTRVLLAARRAG